MKSFHFVLKAAFAQLIQPLLCFGCKSILQPGSGASHADVCQPEYHAYQLQILLSYLCLFSCYILQECWPLTVKYSFSASTAILSVIRSRSVFYSWIKFLLSALILSHFIHSYLNITTENNRWQHTPLSNGKYYFQILFGINYFLSIVLPHSHFSFITDL